MRLKRQDATVVAFTKEISGIYGQAATGVKTACVIQPFNFGEVVKQKLKALKVTNNTALPEKYDLVPTEARLTVLAF